MKNCIILGSGRSGTSMVAGILAGAGYFMGNNLLPATEANPKGFYESREVELLNDTIVGKLVNARPNKWERLREYFLPAPVQVIDQKQHDWAMAGWLALIPPYRTYGLALSPEHNAQIEALVSKQPFCYKDPRFCYTLPFWMPYLDLDNTVFIVVFRDPAVTAASILKEVEQSPYLQGISMDMAQAQQLWTYMYTRVLAYEKQGGQWLFLHYEQCFDPQHTGKLQALTGADGLNIAFPDRQLKRTQTRHPVSKAARPVYATLCRKAGYDC